MFTLIIAPLLENVTPPGALNRSNTVFITELSYVSCSLVLDMTSIDFRFTGSKVKVTRITCYTMYKEFSLIILRTIYHRAFIVHVLIGLGGDMTFDDFIKSKVKVTMVTFV